MEEGPLHRSARDRSALAPARIPFLRAVDLNARGAGRLRISRELQALIQRLALENDWRARKVQAELEKLGFHVSLATVSRYLPKRDPDLHRRQGWITFLRNHRDAIAAMDFLTHNDAIFSDRVEETIEHLGIEPKRTAFRSPWQNGLAERWVGTLRRELLDHVIAIDEQHLRRLLREYVEYYDKERIHTLGSATRHGDHLPSPDRHSVLESSDYLELVAFIIDTYGEKPRRCC